MMGIITKIQDVTHNIRILTIQMDGAEPYRFTAGQYTTLSVDGFEARPFSIASAPRDDNSFDIHIRNSGYNISDRLCTDAKICDAVEVGQAQGSLALHKNKNHHIFIAGGTGITPFLSILEAHPNIRGQLYWGMQSTHDFYIQPTYDNLEIFYCTDIYPIDAFLDKKDQIIKDYSVYLSGPPAMVQDSKAKLLAFGYEEENIIYDR
jgi:ferredoxin-NADP reductase